MLNISFNFLVANFVFFKFYCVLDTHTFIVAVPWRKDEQI